MATAIGCSGSNVKELTGITGPLVVGIGSTGITKSIDTLVEDIYATFSGDPFSEDALEAFGRTLGNTLGSRITSQRATPTLRGSNLGSKCDRKLYYSINQPGDAEHLPPSARFKFLYGDLLEELLLFLAAQAGHRVEAQQAEVNVNGVLGHIDAIIDGRLVDVKSASTYGFKKFESNGLGSDDPFGYLDQIGAYHYALRDDPRITDRGVVSFLAVDKTLGHIVLDSYVAPEKDYDALVDQKRAMLAQKEPPSRAYAPVPDGKSGNLKLGVSCSYCDFKRTCYPELRTFIYSSGPTFLVETVREPKVAEIGHNGKVIDKF